MNRGEYQHKRCYCTATLWSIVPLYMRCKLLMFSCTYNSSSSLKSLINCNSVIRLWRLCWDGWHGFHWLRYSLMSRTLDCHLPSRRTCSGYSFSDLFLRWVSQYDNAMSENLWGHVVWVLAALCLLKFPGNTLECLKQGRFLRRNASPSSISKDI